MRILFKDDFFIIGVKLICKEEELFIKIPKLYEDFFKRKTQIINKKNENILEICLNKINNVYTYLICQEVNDLNDIPEGFEGISIKSAKYLYKSFKGNDEDVYDAFIKMYDYAFDN